ATDLGLVPAAEASAWLLALAEKNEPASEEAVFPATIGEGVTAWPALLRIARNQEVQKKVRRSAIFWLGQAAGEAATLGLDSITQDQRQDREVRESAIFALSQRPKDEGVPALIRVAKSNRDPELRKKALFWLGQSEDPAALALFEELLTRP
ncbi:MAG: HEAT repeat domain-containing protein, partial [Gemmatimonadota bacterium]